MQKKLNVCLHNIVATANDIETIYDLTEAQLLKLAGLLKSLRKQEIITSYEIFFDDGHESAKRAIRCVDFGINRKYIHFAVITDLINQPNRLTDQDIKVLKEEGYCVESHGTSHAALAIFTDDKLQPSPPNGEYRNSDIGKGKILSSEEIKYQLIESYKSLTSITGQPTVSFVLPYGLYNEHVIYLSASTKYHRIYSCDSAFDDGQFLASRLIVTQETIERLDSIIRHLPTIPHLLTD